MAEDHYTAEGVGFVDATRPDAVEEARKRHHLATADPEPERDGQMTGPAHEAKYGLERAEVSAELWRQAGVHPTENRALVPGDEGYQDPAEVAGVGIETADAASADEDTAAPRASRRK